MSAVAVRLPELGDDGKESATVSLWQVEEGQTVVVDDELVELSTETETFNIPSPVTGTVRQILVEEDEVVTVGDTLCIIERE